MRGKNQLFFVFAATIVVLLALSTVSAGFSDFFKTFTGKATSNPVVVNITIANVTPQIIRVFSVADQSITENSKTNFLINFTAQDGDGYGDLNVTTAKINLTRTGEVPVRQNTTCLRYQQGGTVANFSCVLEVWYFDSAGEWNISVYISDNTTRNATNMSTNFTVLQTSAFVAGPSAITFSAISPGSQNTTAANDPIVFNNTGNKPITAGNVQVNATNLAGETDPTKAIYAGNFSVGITSGVSNECGGSGSTLMVRSDFAPIAGSTLPRGNNSVNDGSTGQEQLYICIVRVGSELTAQSYSTANQGSWTAKVI